MAKKKEIVELIKCLYHTQKPCNCIKPVVDTDELKKRLERDVKRAEVFARLGLIDKWS